MEGWQAGWPLHIFAEKCAFFDMPWNYQSHNVLRGDVHIKPVCSLHLCLPNKSERAQITRQIQKACQEKQNIPTATFKNERIVEGTCVDSLILLPLKEGVTLLVTSVELTQPVGISLCSYQGSTCREPEPSQGPPVSFSDLWQHPQIFSKFRWENSARTLSLSHK